MADRICRYNPDSAFRRRRGRSLRDVIATTVGWMQGPCHDRGGFTGPAGTRIGDLESPEASRAGPRPGAAYATPKPGNGGFSIFSIKRDVVSGFVSIEGEAKALKFKLEKHGWAR